MGSLAIHCEVAPAYGAQAWTEAEQQLIEQAMKLLESRLRTGPLLNDPHTVGRYLATYFAGAAVEHFVGLMLDTQHRLMATVELARGTLDGASVYPREVVKAALAHQAAAVVFAHNHPSGMAEPSHADRALTERLSQALRLVEVRTLDHFVVGGTSFVSFAERGWL